MNVPKRTKVLLSILLLTVVFFFVITPVSAETVLFNLTEQRISDITDAFEFTNSELGLSDTTRRLADPIDEPERGVVKVRIPPTQKSTRETINASLHVLSDDTFTSFLTNTVDNKSNCITGYGMDHTGSLLLLVNRDYRESELDTFLRELDELTSQTNRSVLPVTFRTFSLNISTVDPNIRTFPATRATQHDRWRPIIGGIHGYAVDNGGIDNTIGFAAMKNGQKGFVTHGHLLTTQAQMYQPAYQDSTTLLGTVNQIGRTYSDSGNRIGTSGRNHL